MHAILFIAIIVAFCGTATADQQNNIQNTQSDINSQTTVNDQATTSPVQDNSIVDTSSTSSTQNNIQDTQSDTNSQTTANNQATTSSVQDNSIADTSSTSSQNNLQDTQSDTNPQTTQNVVNNDTTTSYTANEDPIVITFDDGFESTYTIAYPIMQQYGIVGTVYVVPSWIGSPGYLTLAELTYTT